MLGGGEAGKKNLASVKAAVRMRRLRSPSYKFLMENGCVSLPNRTSLEIKGERKKRGRILKRSLFVVRAEGIEYMLGKQTSCVVKISGKNGATHALRGM